MTKRRFITSVTAAAAAANDLPQMPWARGKRRAAFIAKRKAPQPVRRSA